MLAGYGWCVLRSSRERYRSASADSIDDIDSMVQLADQKLWANFRTWMAANTEEFLCWTLYEQLNNSTGILQFCVSRNHRASTVWEMIDWIATNGPGSYGLFYVQDDEDGPGNTAHGRGTSDFSNVFRVHRIASGQVTELDDPFLSPIVPLINPSDLA